MNRFFIDANAIDQSSAWISGEDANHILRVLRLGVGDYIEVCDGAGLDYAAEIVYIDENVINVQLEELGPSRGEPDTRVTLYQGIPKGSKMDFLVQKTVELGIHRIVPIETERTVTKLRGSKKVEARIRRWQRISHEAAKQSKRGIIPNIEMPITYANIIKEASHDLKLVLWEEEKQVDLMGYLEDKAVKGEKNIGIIIGPEGGLDSREIDNAKEYGWQPITMGPRILRTETAGMASLAAIMFYMGEML